MKTPQCPSCFNHFYLRLRFIQPLGLDMSIPDWCAAARSVIGLRNGYG
jgi:hypothetical protein